MSASFSITIEGKGTFTASIADPEASVTVGTNTPASFTAEVAPVGPAGATGATGPAGVVTATAPITYNSGTQTVAMDTAYFVRSPETAATDGQIIAWDDATARPLWIDNYARSLFSTVRNETGATLTAGTVVYISGAAGNKALVTKAQANTEAASSLTFAVIATAIPNNQNGTAIVAGELGKLDTTAFAEGATLYLSPTTAGTFTTTKPTAPNHIVYIGTVTRVHANQGTIEVRIQNGSELDEMADVLLTSKADKDLLVYESSSSLWKNKSIATLDLLTATTAASTYQTQAGMTSYYLASNPSGYITSSALTPYLTTATAASTYAPLASPTFTGTVTIPAGASISGFAPLASPTFTGDPKAPTPTAGDNDTSIATTAFVTTANPDATTSVKGHVQLATLTETATSVNATKATTPASVLYARMSPALFSNIHNNLQSASSGTGAGATSTDIGNRQFTGTTSGAYGISRLGSNATYPTSRGKAVGVIDWTKEAAISAAINSNQFVANSVIRFNLGTPGNVTTADLGTRGIGIRISGTSAVELQVHDGTTLVNEPSSFTPTANSTFDVFVHSLGNGTVNLYINDSIVATTSAGPSTAGTSTQDYIQMSANTTAVLSGQTIVAYARPQFYLGR
jgi:hypothetical protein